MFVWPLAAVHLAPAYGVSIGAVLVALLVIYLRRLDDGDVPPLRRRVRRAATAIMIVLVLLLVVAMSFADAAVHRLLYVASWSAVMLLVLVLVMLAVIDGMISSWMLRTDMETAAALSAWEVRKAMKLAEDEAENEAGTELAGEAKHAREPARDDAASSVDPPSGDGPPRSGPSEPAS